MIVLLFALLSIQQLECDADTPHLSVGDLNITENNYMDYMNSPDPIILGISDSDCENCCYLESLLDKVHEFSQNHTYKGNPLKMGRIDLKYMRGIGPVKDMEKLLVIPKMVVWKHKKLYPYNSYLHYPLALYFINKIIQPYITLDSIEEIERFIDTSTEYVEQNEYYSLAYEAIHPSFPGKPHKVLMLVKDISEYKAQIRKYKELALKMSYRVELRFAICTNSSIITALKQKHPNWFSELLSNSVVLFRETNDIDHVDLADFDMHYLEDWINQESVRKVITIDLNTLVIFEKIVSPKVIGYFNTNTHFVMIELLKRISKAHPEYIFGMADEISRPVPNSRIVVSYKSGATFVYPEHMPLTDSMLSQFLLNISTDSIAPTYNIARIEEGEKVISSLKHTRLLRLKDLNATLEQDLQRKGKNVLMLVINSKQSTDQRAAEEFDTVANNLKRVYDISIFYFDGLLDTIPLEYRELAFPKVLLYSPQHNTKYEVMTGEIEESSIMRFITSHRIKVDL